MKKIFLFFTLSLYLLGAKSLEEIYLENGINAVQKEIEKNLQSKKHWQDILANKELKYGYYDVNTLVTIVDKTAKNLELLEFSDGKLESKFKQENIITGLMGDKLKEGDLKTPVGAYHITRHFKPSDGYYGPAAFSLNYPNLYDTLRKRDGGGIWIHGLPFDGERIDTEKTKGCVAFNNDNLIQYEKIVGDKGGVVLINEKDYVKATNEQIAAIFAQLFAWKHAWSVSDVEKYLEFYDKEFIRFDGQKYKDFVAMKRNIFARKEDKFIAFSKFKIMPYPSTQKGSFFKINFYEKYSTANYKFDGEKTLYVRLDGDKMKILVEE